MAVDQKIRDKHEELLKLMTPGMSFFVEARPCELGYVRKMGYRLGLKLSIRAVAEDEIYGVEGSRVILRG